MTPEQDILETATARVHHLLGARPDASSVIHVHPDGMAIESFQVGHQNDLCAEEAVDLINNPGIKVQRTLPNIN
jgi:hypothetical protein